MKLADFGPFVIFTALYAAGSLGLPEIPLLAYQVKVAEIPTAFVAIFGLPAVFGLVLGQFIANIGFQASSIEMMSPLVALIGLAAVYYLRKSSVLGGIVLYVIMTSTWVAYELMTVPPKVSGDLAILSAFSGQVIAVGIGYVGYKIATSLMRLRIGSAV